MRDVGRLAVGAFVLIGIACSTVSDAPIGSSSEALLGLTLGTNYPVALANMHYASVLSAKFPGTGIWHWVVAFDNLSFDQPLVGFIGNNDKVNLMGWNYSSTLTGSSWQPVPGPTAPIGPWEETHWVPSGTPSTCTTTNSWYGWLGDPTIALIGNAAHSASGPDGTSLMMAGLTTTPGSYPVGNDVAVVLSQDGGQTFSSLWNGGATKSYLSQPTGGCFTDSPQIVSNPSAPYSTFASWTSYINNPPLPEVGWLTSINNIWPYVPGTSSSAAHWTGSAIPVNGNPKNGVRWPKIAVANVPWAYGGNGCTGAATHEIVYVAYVPETVTIGHSCIAMGNPTTIPVTWLLTAYDNTANTWAPVQTVDVDPVWPECIAEGENEPLQTGSIQNSNLPFPSVATQGPFVAVAHNQWTSRGTRIRVGTWAATCSNNNLNLAPVNIFQAPDPCYHIGGNTWCPPGGGGGNGADGGNVVNDQWGAQVAFQLKGATPEFLVTWYDTSGDPTNTMTRVNYAVNQTIGITGNPFFTTAADGGTIPTIFQLSETSPSPPGFAGQAIPWASNSAAWWDYQGIGVDPGSQSFFAAWGGDGRLVNGMANGPSGVWGVQLQ